MRSSGAAEFVTRWWAGQGGAAGSALTVLTAPLEWLYRLGMAARNAAYERGMSPAHRAGVPVISVGNLVVGGSGKTPVSAWLVRELQRRGRHPALLHGGYAADEPALHRLWAPEVPVVAGLDRVAGAAAARAAGADAIVLDDGFQHRRLARDLDLLLVSAEQWSMPRRLLPRGPWREPLRAARRATVIAVTSRSASPERARAVAAELQLLLPAVPVIALGIRPAGWLRDGQPAPHPSGPVLAVAAVAHPRTFVENARAAGARVAGELCWRDHHDYNAADAALIAERAAGGAVATTPKDWIKLQRLLPGARVWVLAEEVTVESGEAELRQALERVLS
jgi:tetraacyldisaccharide 4'-kinase